MSKCNDCGVSAPIDIQILLNGAAKFCRHCDVVILNNMLRKKASDFPIQSRDNNDHFGDEDELYFCSSTCYMQFALMHKSPTLTEDKVSDFFIAKFSINFYWYCAYRPPQS